MNIYKLMHKKKYLTVCAIIVCIILLLSGCNNNPASAETNKELFIFDSGIINYSLNVSQSLGVEKIFIPIITSHIDKSEVMFLRAEGANIDDLIITGEYKIDNFLTPIYITNQTNYFMHKIELEIIAGDEFDVNLLNRQITSVCISICGIEYSLPAIININPVSDSEQRYFNLVSSVNSNKVGANIRNKIIEEDFYSDIINIYEYGGDNGGSYTIESIEYSAGYFDIEDVNIRNFFNDDELIYDIQDSDNCNVAIYDLKNLYISYERIINEDYEDFIFLGDTFVLSYHTSADENTKQLYDRFICGYQEDKLTQYLDENFEEELITIID